MIPATRIMQPSRSVAWTKERIATLGTPEVWQLRANAERLNDPEIMGRCDEVLGERPRSGASKPGARRRKKKVVATSGAA